MENVNKVGSCSFCFYQARCSTQVNKKTLAIFDFNKYLTMKKLAHVAFGIIEKYFPPFS